MRGSLRLAFFDSDNPLSYWLTARLGLPFWASAPISDMLQRLVVVTALTVGLLLILQGTRGLHNHALLGLMLVLVSVLLLVASITAGVITVLLLLSALATLGATSLALVRRRSIQFRSLTVLCVNLFIVLAGLETVNWYGDLADWLTARGEQSVVWLGVIFLVLMLRDIMTSGDLLTGEESIAYPKAGRIALYFGYILVLSAIALFAGTIHVQADAPYPYDIVSQNLNIDLAAQTALNVLGIALIALTFVLRIGHWRTGMVYARRTARGSAARARWPHTRLVQSGVLLAGLVALVAVAASGMKGVEANPETTQAGATVQTMMLYRAHAPGQSCDRGGALWFQLGGTLTCTSAGTQVGVNPSTYAQLEFIPAHGWFAPTYQVAIGVDFRGVELGCLAVRAGESLTTYDYDKICSNGSWAIWRYPTHPSGTSSASTHIILAHGSVPKAVSYVIAVDIGRTSEHLSINGLVIGGDPNMLLSQTECYIRAINFGSRAGFITLSDFVYTPHP